VGGEGGEATGGGRRRRQEEGGETGRGDGTSASQSASPLTRDVADVWVTRQALRALWRLCHGHDDNCCVAVGASLHAVSGAAASAPAAGGAGAAASQGGGAGAGDMTDRRLLETLIRVR
jgi:hypothetical protein